jgi:hypothetical protein
MNYLDPKANFANHPQKKQFEEFVHAEVFHAGAQAALIITQKTLSAATGNDAAANFYRMEGARKILDTLMNLTVEEKEPAKLPSTNLKHV